MSTVMSKLTTMNQAKQLIANPNYTSDVTTIRDYFPNGSTNEDVLKLIAARVNENDNHELQQNFEYLQERLNKAEYVFIEFVGESSIYITTFIPKL